MVVLHFGGPRDGMRISIPDGTTGYTVPEEDETSLFGTREFSPEWMAMKITSYRIEKLFRPSRDPVYIAVHESMSVDGVLAKINEADR